MYVEVQREEVPHQPEESEEENGSLRLLNN